MPTDPAPRRPWPLLRFLAWCTVVGAYPALAFGWAWRWPADGMGDLAAALTFAALLIQTFSLHAGIALGVVAAFGACLRMKRLLLAAAPLLLWTLGPAAWSWVRPMPSPSGGPVFTVFSANLLYGEADTDNLVAQIRAADADVVLLQEYTPASVQELRPALHGAYPHALSLPQQDAFGQAVFSRLPFTSGPELFNDGGRFLVPLIVFEVEWEGRRIAIWNVHLLPPASVQGVRLQREMAAWLAARAEERMARGGVDALVVAGDFNAPYRTNHLRELRGAGLGEAHDAAGRGRGGTWPRNSWLRHFPPIRLDHAMYRGSLRCVGARVGDDFGSDHRPVVAVFEAASP